METHESLFLRRLLSYKRSKDSLYRRIPREDRTRPLSFSKVKVKRLDTSLQLSWLQRTKCALIIKAWLWQKQKRKVKANLNNYTRQNHKVEHNYYNKTNYFIGRNKTNYIMESGDSCSRLRMSSLFHLGQCHGWIFGKRLWRALDAYSGDHGKVDKGNLFGILTWVMFEWLC